MPVVMEISFYHYYSGKSLMRLQSRDCTFVQKAGFSLQFHCSLTVKVCSVDRLQKGKPKRWNPKEPGSGRAEIPKGQDHKELGLAQARFPEVPTPEGARTPKGRDPKGPLS